MKSGSLIFAASLIAATMPAASQTSVEPADLPIKGGTMVSRSFDCHDGTSMRVTFDNSRSYAVALVTHDSMESDVVSEDVPLIAVVTGSGAKYSNGDYTLTTKSGEALLTRGETLYRCRAN